jgi:hypothetical protein
VQDFVYHVFVTVAGIIATLLTVGLTGIITLLVLDRDSTHGAPDYARVNLKDSVTSTSTALPSLVPGLNVH